MAKQKPDDSKTPITFVLSDESLNLYGFRVLTEGIDISRYQLNPVVCAMHEMGVLSVVGRATNLRKEKGQLLADVEFDYDDPDAARIAGKVDRGFVRACSIGIDFKKVTSSETPEGKVEYVTEACELLEWSIVGVGANRHAVRVLSAGQWLNLDSATSAALSAQYASAPVEALSTDTKPTTTSMDLKAMAAKLGLPNDATEAQVQAALDAKLSSASQVETLQAQLKAERDGKTKAALDTAIAEKRILPGERKDFEELAEVNPTLFEKTLSLRQPAVNLVTKANQGKAATETAPGAGKETKAQLAAEWNRLHKEEGLVELRAEDPDRYNLLYAARYGHVKVEAVKGVAKED